MNAIASASAQQWPSPASHAVDLAAGSRLRVVVDLVPVRTERLFQLVDITGLVAERVRCSGIRHGLVCVQSLHTTAAVVVNENERLLALDLERTLERLAPRSARYAHDDLERRGSEIAPGERSNGHSHCKALVLPVSVTVTVIDGRPRFGRWQRVFLAELDGGQPRSLSILMVGTVSDDVEPPIR